MRLSLEHLETRLVPAAITDMTALAASLVQTPTNPTHIYLNFDGFQDSTHTVAAYNDSAQTVNDVIFRVSELFSPFNVEVSRLGGAGRQTGYGLFDASNGNTTIFIGDDTANTTNTGFLSELTGGPKNNANAYTPPQFSDHPGETLGDKHTPHSIGNHLAFIDPIGDTEVWSPLQISQAIAHEAGHTFGLGHVLTKPKGEPLFTLPSDKTSDIMSYDNPNAYFADTTYDLTDLNYNPATGKTAPTSSVLPKYDGTPLQTQNSFTYLEQVLGDRPDDGHSHVVHSGSVDFDHFTAPAVTNLTRSSVKIGTIARAGDYMVYWMKADANNNYDLEVNVTPTAAGGYNLDSPNLLVYNKGNLVQYVDSDWNPASQLQEIHTSVSLTAGQTYAFVIGGRDGNSTGGYRLETKVPLDQVAGAVNKDVVGSWSNDAKGVFADPNNILITTVGTWSNDAKGVFADPNNILITTVGTWTAASSRSGAKRPAYTLTSFVQAPVAVTPIAPKPADVPVSLTAADFSSLGSGDSFRASVQDAIFEALKAEPAAAQTPDDLSSPVLPLVEVSAEVPTVDLSSPVLPLVEVSAEVPTVDVSAELTAANVVSLNNDPAFVASAHDTDSQAAVPEIAVAQETADLSTPVPPGDAFWAVLATDPSMLTPYSLV